MPSTISNGCRVAQCRHPDTHVTSRHQCGVCHAFGHGLLECGDEAAIGRLNVFRNERMARTMQCRLVCRFKQFHTTEGHRCNICNTYGHDRTHHQRRPVASPAAAAAVAAESSSGPSIRCPTCRAVSNFSDWNRTFVEAACAICFDTHNMVVSPCGHGFCDDCVGKCRSSSSV